MATLVNENTNMEGFVIKPSKIHGFGLFADRDFAPGEWVLRFDNDAHWFANHSCDPSCHIKEVYVTDIRSDYLFATDKGIKKGEEITWDYNHSRWNKFWRDMIEAKCNCPKCREKQETNNITE